MTGKDVKGMKIGISTDCICDLPEDYLLANGVDVMHFYIHTATGRFRDGDEITSDNILEYLESGEVIVRSNVPDAPEYKKFFDRNLKKYDVLIHITTSDKVGRSYPNATTALKTLMLPKDAQRVTLVNSMSLSTGLGHMVLRAVALRDEGKSVPEIVEECERMRDKIASSFIVPNADYLYRMGYVGRGVQILSRLFHIHPVIAIKNGKLGVKSFQLGNYDKAILRYVRSEFQQSETIDRRQLFITHAGSPARIIGQIKDMADALCPFENVTVTKASAAISSNCGPETVGVLFVHE